jgi:hypothetical protein
MTPGNKLIKHILEIPENYPDVSDKEIYELYNHSLMISGTKGLKVKVNAAAGFEVEPSWALGTPSCRKIAVKILKAKVDKHNIRQIVVGGHRDHAVLWALLAAAPEANIAFLNMSEVTENADKKEKFSANTGLYGHLDKDVPTWLIGGKLILGRAYAEQIHILKNTYGFNISGLLTLFSTINGGGMNVMRTVQYLCDIDKKDNTGSKNKFIYDYCIGISNKPKKSEEISTIPFWTSNNITYAT